MPCTWATYIHEIFSTNSFKTAIRENLDPRNISTIQYTHKCITHCKSSYIKTHSRHSCLPLPTACTCSLVWPHPLIQGEDLVCLVSMNNRKPVISNQITEWPIRGILGLCDITLSWNVQIQHGNNAFVEEVSCCKPGKCWLLTSLGS